VGRTESVLEKDGEVVDNCVATRKLLHHLRGSTQKHTAKVLRLSVGENSGELGLATTTGEADGLLDDTHLNLDFRVLARETVESGHDSCSFLLAVVSEEPAWRFRELSHHDKDDESEDDLESNGEAPGEIVRAVETTVVDPVRNQRANGDVAALNADDLTAVLRAAALGLVGGDSRGVDTVSDTSDASSNDELRGSTAIRRNRGDLDDDTKDHDRSTEEDGIAASKLVSNDLGECLDECGGGDNTRHDTLVISEEEEIGGSNDGDQDLQHPAGLPPVGGNARLIFSVRCHSEDWLINEVWREMMGTEWWGEGPFLTDRLNCHEPKFTSRWREGSDQRSTWFHNYQHRSDTRSKLDNNFHIISDLAVVASISDVADG
jgi:hypothetical protein